MILVWILLYPLVLIFLGIAILSLKNPERFRAKGLSELDHKKLDRNAWIGIAILAPVFILMTIAGKVPQNIYKAGSDFLHMNTSSDGQDTSDCDPLYGC